ncbi:hypothetical protein C7M84_013813 [Penaeus vannamei]|uniref:Uncharacterized protein n=2 Tax=Penaeus vannamei TaxID=6689 RepID=A0A423SV10_PENVA|nr:hypothetical protein C7M84_013813 [Penaeus vannamei]
MGGVPCSIGGGSFGSCNGDVLTASSRDSLLGHRAKQGDMMDSFRAEDTTLPILGIQKLGETPGRHVVLEGMRPLGTALSTSCSSFRGGVPTGALGTVGGLASLTGTTGLIETPSTSASHLLQVTLIPEEAGKDRSPSRVPRISEGVSVL